MDEFGPFFKYRLLFLSFEVLVFGVNFLNFLCKLFGGFSNFIFFVAISKAGKKKLGV